MFLTQPVIHLTLY